MFTPIAFSLLGALSSLERADIPAVDAPAPPAVRAEAARATWSALQAEITADVGRVEFLADSGRVELVPLGQRRACRGPTHIEVGAGARAKVGWIGLGSVVLKGPCVLEWSTRTDVLTPPGSVAPIVCVFDRVTGAEFELRAAPLQLELPGGWRVAAERAAFGVVNLGAGACRVMPHAGEPVSVFGPRDARTLWPRHDVAAGTELVLDLAESATPRFDTTRYAAPWKSVEWPWAPRGTPAFPPTASVAPAPGVAADDTSSAEDALVPTPRVVTEETPASAVPSPTPVRVPEEPAIALVPFVAGDWRGLAHADLSPHGAWTIERSADLVFVERGAGRFELDLPGAAAKALWCLGPEFDVEIAPGTTLLMFDDGRMGAYLGTVRVHAAPAGRPAFARVAPPNSR